MIKLRSRYPRLIQLIIANTVTVAIKAAEENRPEGEVLRKLATLLNNFTLIIYCVGTPLLQGGIGVMVNGFSPLMAS